MSDLAISEVRVEEATRRFTMRDVMILVVAAAVGSGMARSVLVRDRLVSTPLIYVLMAAIAGCVTLTPTLLLLHRFRPRPPISELCRRPGFAAILASSTIMGLELMATVILAVIRAIKSGRLTPTGRPALTPYPLWWMDVVFHFGVLIGPAVVATWVFLALSGNRRPSGDWLDILGRMVGTGWVVLFVTKCCADLARLTD